MNKEYIGKLDRLAEHYNSLAREYGYSHHAVQQSSSETQNKRFKVLLEGFPGFRNKKILDFGCGSGHFYEFLKSVGFEGEYVGYDISEQQIKVARKTHPKARFELLNIFENPIEELFDLVFISGVFNNEIGSNVDFMQDSLKILYPLCREGLAFNGLSSYVDFKADGLHYYDPSEVFKFCKEEISSFTTLRHDYEIKPDVMPFEFTFYLKSSNHKPRKNNYV